MNDTTPHDKNNYAYIRSDTTSVRGFASDSVYEAVTPAICSQRIGGISEALRRTGELSVASLFRATVWTEINTAVRGKVGVATGTAVVDIRRCLESSGIDSLRCRFDT